MNLRNILKNQDLDNKSIDKILLELMSLSDHLPTPFKVGKKYLIRTVTMCDVGLLKELHRNFIVLEQASWIADTGRFYQSLLDSSVFNEVERFSGDLIINTEAIVDAVMLHDNYILPNRSTGES